MGIRNPLLEPSGTTRDGWEPEPVPRVRRDGSGDDSPEELLHVKRPGHPDDAEHGRSGRSSPRRLTPARASYGAEQEESPADWSGGLQWFTVEQAARLCMRSPGTIRNMVSEHQLRRRMAWKTVRRRRHRLMLLPHVTVKWLQAVLLFRRRELLEYPPR